jgi:uncharacterized protein YgfB (UPF0149 family)
MAATPLEAALQNVKPKLDAELHPLVDALLAGEAAEQGWQELLQEVLDEA